MVGQRIRTGLGHPAGCEVRDHLRTDAQGRFQGPRRLRRDGEYRALADAQGYSSGRTRPLRPGPSGVLSFPEILLPREARRFAVERLPPDRAPQAVVDHLHELLAGAGVK